MAPSIQELNAQSNPFWDFVSNLRDGNSQNQGEQPPWNAFFRGGPQAWGHGPHGSHGSHGPHGPLPHRNMPQAPHGSDGPRPPPYPTPFGGENPSEGAEGTPATEKEKEKEDHSMDEEVGETSGPPGEHGRREHHGHRHGPRGRGGRGGHCGRGRGWGGPHAWGPQGRGYGGFGGFGNHGRPYWQNMLNEMTKGMGNFGGADNMDSQEFTPPVDVFDTPNAYEIHVSVPGAKKENIAVTYSAEESTVNISGVIERPGDSEFLGYIAMGERQVGAFERKVRLGTRTEPASVDDYRIGAKLEEGVLKVHVPKILKEDEYVEVRKVDIE